MKLSLVQILLLALILTAGALVILNLSSKKNIIPLPTPETKEISFEKVNTSITSKALNVKSNILINNSEEWQKLKPNPLVDIDFSKNSVIAVTAGSKSTGGYSIEVVKIVDLGQNIVVTVKDISPGTNCFVTQALTNPKQVIKTEKLDKQVSFEEISETKNCQ